MRLATQLKMRGYKKGRSGEETESSDDEESSSENEPYISYDSDNDMAYRHLKKSVRRSKKSHRRSEKRQDELKNRTKHREDAAIRDEIKEMRGMLQDLIKSQKTSSLNIKMTAAPSDQDIIHLDSYAVNRTYGSYPHHKRYEYAQFNQGRATNPQTQYPARSSQTRPAIAEYN